MFFLAYYVFLIAHFLLKIKIHFSNPHYDYYYYRNKKFQNVPVSKR